MYSNGLAAPVLVLVSGQRDLLLQETKFAVRKAAMRRSVSRKTDPAEECPSFVSPFVRRAVLRVVKEGALSKAAKILLSAEEALGCEALKALHTLASDPIVSEVSTPPFDDLEPADIAKALKSFPPGHGAGPSGLMAAHLRKGPG